MHVTLHLTLRCNFRCRYCYASQGTADMTTEVAEAAARLAVEDTRRKNGGQSIGIIFFGGEPLLRRDLIEHIISYCRDLTASSGQQFYFKITTNGSLLDHSFLTSDLTSYLCRAQSRWRSGGT